MSPSQELKKQILELVQQYYKLEHQPAQLRPFASGTDRVNYAGRVFDEKEILNLVESSLEFWLTSGRYCDAFETKLAQMLGLKFSLLVNSGSSANLVAFSALTSPLMKDRRIKKGDEVITVAAGFPTTINPIVQFGAVPVFVDVTIEDGTYNIDIQQMEAALSPKTKAVMMAHTLGNPFRLKEVTEFCKKKELFLIEDNCDALGSKYDGKYTGTFGDIGTSSFYPPHHLTMGEGGAIYTSNALIKRAAESFRDWGRDCWCSSGKDNTCKKRFGWELGQLPKGYDHKYVYSHFGYNLKATEMQASVGLAQLEKLETFAAIRRRNFKTLFDGVKDLEDIFILPKATPNSDPSWFGFLLSVRPDAGFARNEMTQYLESKNIQTRMLFAGNYLRQPAFDEMRADPKSHRVVGEMKNADYVTENSFWLGVYPGLKPGMLEYVIENIRSFVGR